MITLNKLILLILGEIGAITSMFVFYRAFRETSSDGEKSGRRITLSLTSLRAPAFYRYKLRQLARLKNSGRPLTPRQQQALIDTQRKLSECQDKANQMQKLPPIFILHQALTVAV